MKLCKDCKHYQDDGRSDIDICTNPYLQKMPDLVRGDVDPNFCCVQRESTRFGLCGKEGRFWEAK